MGSFGGCRRIVLIAFCLSLGVKAGLPSDNSTRAMQKGEKALSQANYSEAIASCRKAIQLNGQSADGHICLANALMQSTLPGMPDIESAGSPQGES